MTDMSEEMTINLGDFFRIIKSRMKLIVLITTLALIAASIYSFYVKKPTYTASTSIIIGKQQETALKETTSKSTTQYNDVMMYQNLVKTYKEIAVSDLVMQGAADNLKNKVSVGDLRSKVSVVPKTDTQIITVTATADSSVKAYTYANAVSDSFVASAKDVFPTGGDIQILDKAKMPSGPSGPNKKLNIAIGFFLGLMLSIGIVFLLEYLDNTIKTEKDVENYLDLPIIGVIPLMHK